MEKERYDYMIENEFLKKEDEEEKNIEFLANEILNSISIYKFCNRG